MGRLKRRFPRPEGAPEVGDDDWSAYLRRCVEGAFRRFENEEFKNEELKIVDYENKKDYVVRD